MQATFAMSNLKTLTTIAVLTGDVLADARADDTSQATSISVAGKGKYCKETMSGYLDCFYASVALATLVVNKPRGGLKVAGVKAPGFGDRRRTMLEDVAILTAGHHDLRRHMSSSKPSLAVTNISDAGSYRGSLGCRALDPDVSQQTARIEDQAVAAASYH
jgi:hypothetical protein